MPSHPIARWYQVIYIYLLIYVYIGSLCFNDKITHNVFHTNLTPIILFDKLIDEYVIDKDSYCNAVKKIAICIFPACMTDIQSSSAPLFQSNQCQIITKLDTHLIFMSFLLDNLQLEIMIWSAN